MPVRGHVELISPAEVRNVIFAQLLFPRNKGIGEGNKAIE
jgi:hypothetical protein